MNGITFSPNAVLGFLTWCLLLLTALHSMFLRKKTGAGFMSLHIMDILFVFVVATVHAALILAKIIENGWPLQLGTILGIATWGLVFLALLMGVFRKPLASALKKAYMAIHILIGILAFAVATTHGMMIMLGQIARLATK
ncbi:MAG: hypothetical protein KA140_00845 [Caldisericia bacterium]|nr:hypothetical protein [Caldisericia bacterium]